MNTLTRITLLSLMTGSLLAGCTSGTEPESNDAKTADGKAGSEQASGIKDAGGYKKPGAPVSLSYKVPDATILGSPIVISVSVTLDSAVDSATISFTDSEGLELVSKSALQFGVQKAGDRHEIELSVIPWEAGLRFVNVFADTQQGGRHLRRAFAIPIAAGGDATRQTDPKNMQEMPDGEKVISLPAKQSD